MITSDKKKKKKKKKKKRPQQTIVNVFQVWTTCKEQYNNYFYTGIYIYMYMSINVNGKKKQESFKPRDPKHLHTLCTTQHLSGLLVVSTLHSVLAVEMLLL